MYKINSTSFKNVHSSVKSKHIWARSAQVLSASKDESYT